MSNGLQVFVKVIAGLSNRNTKRQIVNVKTSNRKNVKQISIVKQNIISGRTRTKF